MSVAQASNRAEASPPAETIMPALALNGLDQNPRPFSGPHGTLERRDIAKRHAGGSRGAKRAKAPSR